MLGPGLLETPAQGFEVNSLVRAEFDLGLERG